MGSRKRAAVQLPAAAMVPAAACVLLLTLAALGVSGQGQIPLGKPTLPPRVASIPYHTGGPMGPRVAAPRGPGTVRRDVQDGESRQQGRGTEGVPGPRRGSKSTGVGGPQTPTPHQRPLSAQVQI